jgi:hypothetical protein
MNLVSARKTTYQLSRPVTWLFDPRLNANASTKMRAKTNIKIIKI